MSKSARNIMEMDNISRTDELSQKVALLKNYAIDIEEETKHHNKLLDEVDDDFLSNFTFLKTTGNRLNRLLRSNRSPKNTCYLSIGICIVLFVIYFILSSKISGSSTATEAKPAL